MGCCVSTGKTFDSSSKSRNQRHSVVGVDAQMPRSSYSHAKLDAVGSRAPPPVEESVKEVLSETPTPKPPPPPLVGSLVDEKRTEKPCSEKIRGEDSIEKKVPSHPAEEISEVSDICSYSESLSTTTITEKMDDFDEVRQRICRSPAKLPKNRSFSDDWGPKRERLVGKSPTRKSDQSPCRRNGSGAGTMKSVQCRDMGQGLARLSLRSEAHQKNRSDSSCRRSRSPATTRADIVGSRTAVGRSPSVRRSGMSPRREATPVRDTNRKEAAQHDTSEGKWPTTNESLENPLVSLECFIFL